MRDEAKIIESSLLSQKGTSLIEVVVGGALLAVILVLILLSIQSISSRISSVRARKAIYPLADEVRVAVSLDLKKYFTDGRPAPYCTGNGTFIPLGRSQPLASGIGLKLLTKASMASFPSVSDSPTYAQAIDYCRGQSPIGADALNFPPSPTDTKSLMGDIFNPPVGSYDTFNKFTFCATVDCPKTGLSAESNRICQYASGPVPMLVLFHYVIRRTANGKAYSCADTREGWPGDAVGELHYLFLWSKPGTKGNEYFMDRGLYYGNRSK